MLLLQCTLGVIKALRSFLIPGNGIGELQVKRGLGKISASSANPPPNPKGKVGGSYIVADGQQSPPFWLVLQFSFFFVV